MKRSKVKETDVKRNKMQQTKMKKIPPNKVKKKKTKCVREGERVNFIEYSQRYFTSSAIFYSLIVYSSAHLLVCLFVCLFQLTGTEPFRNDINEKQIQ